MRLNLFRFSIRRFMILLAVATLLISGSVQTLRWARLRADYLKQVENYRLALEETKKSISEAEAGLADPNEQALLAKLPDDQREAWIVMVDQLRQGRRIYAMAIPRWQHLANHPWEPMPADLHRID